MPIRRFWLLHKSIDRIAAERDQRQLQTLVAIHVGGESVSKYHDSLMKQVGDVAVIDKVRAALNEKIDRKGIGELLAMRKQELKDV